MLLERYIKEKLGLPSDETVGQFYARWIRGKRPPLVRESRARDYRQHFEAYILPRFGNHALDAVTFKKIAEFRSELITRVRLKTARNIIGSSFRAMWRDVRAEGATDRDPFGPLTWPAAQAGNPDPFTQEEREKILRYMAKRAPFFYPVVYFFFWTGARPSEIAALRVDDVDLEGAVVAITKSRHMGRDDRPKTTASRRAIAILPNVVKVARRWARMRREINDFFFQNMIGGPLNLNDWARFHWPKILEGAGVRRRNFYSCRDTFISHALTQGVNLKWLQEYCATSIAMIERRYGRYMNPDQSELLKIEPKPNRDGAKFAKVNVVPTGIEPESGESDKLRQHAKR